MHTPNALRMASSSEAHDLIDAFPFGVLVSPDLCATHLPFLLERTAGEFGELQTHLARANPHWEGLDGVEVLVIFRGPHGYVSPSWYAKGPGVPTWNYVAVHARGRARLLSAEATRDVLHRQVRAMEPELLDRGDILTPEYADRLAAGVVGVGIDITHLTGKQKLGQQRSAADQRGVHAALAGSANASSRELAAFMESRQLGTGE